MSVLAIEEERVNSVEDGKTNQRGAKKFHLSLPVRGRKAIGTRQLYRNKIPIPSKYSVHSLQNCCRVGTSTGPATAGVRDKEKTRQARSPLAGLQPEDAPVGQTVSRTGVLAAGVTHRTVNAHMLLAGLRANAPPDERAALRHNCPR
ncbi:MAG TPA: hypothetical protein VK749_09890 [Xanthobacteraceae bacterium]|nr:hypothetical protein [Xanthobacteraceae bacterium]